MTKELQIPGNVKTAFYWTEDLFRTLLKDDMNKIALGGGTVLAMHWKHRISTDLDYFLVTTNMNDAGRIIGSLTEPLHILEANKKIRDLEHSPLNLKFFVQDTETTLFTTHNMTNEPPEHREPATGIRLENIDEILAKKLKGRIMGLGTFTARDFYDFCIAAHKKPGALRKAIATCSKGEMDSITHQLKNWRRSDQIRETRTNKQLIKPRYPKIADKLWDCAEEALRTGKLPEDLFMEQLSPHQVIET